jgi:hypothetical protein
LKKSLGDPFNGTNEGDQNISPSHNAAENLFEINSSQSSNSNRRIRADKSND